VFDIPIAHFPIAGNHAALLLPQRRQLAGLVTLLLARQPLPEARQTRRRRVLLVPAAEVPAVRFATVAQLRIAHLLATHSVFGEAHAKRAADKGGVLAGKVIDSGSRQFLGAVGPGPTRVIQLA
jgi:hypothetical protein